MNRLYRSIEILKGHIEVSHENIDWVEVYEGDLVDVSKLESFDFKGVKLPWHLEGADQRYFLRCTHVVGKIPQGTSYRIHVSTGKEGQWDAVNPQMLAYINGQAVCGLDMNHQEIYIDPALEGQILQIGLHVYTGMAPGDMVLRLKAVLRNDRVHEAYYDLKVAYDVMDLHGTDTEDYAYLHKHLHKAVESMDIEDLSPFMAYMDQHVYGLDQVASPYTVHAIGHTHIDVAWLWDLRQTREKVARSYQTALDLQSRYPKYKFMASQPYLYEMLESTRPDIFKKVCKAHNDGWWTSEGAMYLEADCNLIGGESLIRQIEWGQEYLDQTFNHSSRVLWLPDVFGYSAALPQVLKGFDIDLFVTSKISWNDTNILPYDSFRWMGIDGSEIATQFITTMSMDAYKKGTFKTIYEGNYTPSEVLGAVKRHQQRDLQPHVIMPYGFGDGGGGANENMLAFGDRLSRGIKGMPRLVHSDLETFTKAYQETSLDELPLWRGELYLEYHRGTYTTNGLIKKLHRTLEDLLLRTEKIQAILSLHKVELSGDLKEHWQVLLLNQFHDILPGTSIERVYTEAYGQLEKSIEALEGILGQYGDKTPVYVGLNPHGYRGSFRVKTSQVDESMYSQDLGGGMSLLAYDAPKESSVSIGGPYEFQTPFYEVSMNEKGVLTRLYDKTKAREVLSDEGQGNRLSFYRDHPMEWDAWDISSDYQAFPLDMSFGHEVAVDSEGALATVIEVKSKFRKSTIVQKIFFYKNHRAIDFETQVDWRDNHVLLKADFDLNIHANHCKYSIQYGHVERPIDKNHTYNQAMFEVCSQHWANLSEGDYNISLMSNDKFGYSCDHKKLSLTLLKSPTWPNPSSDQGLHEFSYRLLAMDGHFSQGHIHQAFKDYAHPPIALNAGYRPWFDAFKDLPDNMSLEAFRSIGQGRLQMRLVELEGRQGRFTCPRAFESYGVYKTQMNGRQKQALQGPRQITYRAFEIITLEIQI